MGLEKAIEHGKEHRKPYRGSKAIDPMCRNHCGCLWCEENRQIHDKRDREKCQDEIDEVLGNDNKYDISLYRFNRGIKNWDTYLRLKGDAENASL